ncbi:hypothetical protein P3T76_005685 [Phytophthora citrophthora]|uniref:Uncharacterized protein n=1 Tax=Phytophthora citrophthora TaxID=4793 RepID=A0AAD9GRR8_9STRA|nr:hypothetical protein P3T76_005685 [Phytophthora citrophthora]
MPQRFADPDQDWAESITEQWTKETKDQWNRYKRSQTMVRVRAKKKQQLEQLRSERRDLEYERKQQMRKLADTQGNVSDAMYRLSIEGESLREENSTLRHKLQERDRFLSVSSQALVTIASNSEEDSVPQTVRDL